jgi:phosphoribosylaminoimidazole-succinocarboxamide synthase
VREWLIANGFQGKEGQIIPEMSDEWVEQISARYIELFEKVTGKTFIKANTEDILGRIEENVLRSLTSH